MGIVKHVALTDARYSIRFHLWEVAPHSQVCRVPFASYSPSRDKPLQDLMFHHLGCRDRGRTLLVLILGDGELDGAWKHMVSEHLLSTFKAQPRKAHVPSSTTYHVVGTLHRIRRPRIPFLVSYFFILPPSE